MRGRGRTVLAGIALAILLALPLIPEIAGTRRLVFRDAHITHWPWRRAAVESLAAGAVPFVNEAASGGQPLLANPNAAVLYPTLLLEKILPPASAFNLHYLLHVFWAFLGARLLARKLGLSEGSAFTAGVAFAFSGIALSYGSAFFNSSAAASWLPWCAAAATVLARAPRRVPALRAGAALGAGLGLQLLAGEPAISLLTGLLCAFILLLEVFAGPPRPPARAGRVIAGIGTAAVIALTLAAPLLAPLGQILPLTYRGQHVYSDRAFSAAPLDPWRLMELLFPRFGGDPGALGVGAHWQHALHPGDLIYIWRVTLGIVPLVLVLLAFLSRRYWNRWTIGWAAAALITLLFSLGARLPLYPALGSVELLRRLRYPIKFYLLTSLCVAILAGFAVELYRERRPRLRESLVLALLLAGYAAAFYAASAGGVLDRWVQPRLAGLALAPAALMPEIRSVFRGDAVLGGAAVLLVALLLFIRPRAPAPGYLLGFGAALLALPWALPLFVSAPERELRRPPAVLHALTGEGRLYVSPALPEFNVLATGTAHPQLPPRVARLARVQIEELIPGTGIPFGVRYAFDADPDGSYGWYNRLAAEALRASAPEERMRILRAYGARWILAEEGESYPGARPLTGMTIAGRRLALLEIPEPIAELRWAGREFRRSSLSGALDLVRSARFDPASDVVLPGRKDLDPSYPFSGARLDLGRGSRGLSVGILAGRPGFLVYGRTYFPAWQASLDGEPARIHVANARDLAVSVPAGRHRVDFTWDRSPFRTGVLLQMCGFLAVLVAAAVPRGRHRKGHAGRPEGGVRSQPAASSGQPVATVPPRPG